MNEVGSVRVGLVRDEIQAGVRQIASPFLFRGETGLLRPDAILTVRVIDGLREGRVAFDQAELRVVSIRRVRPVVLQAEVLGLQGVDQFVGQSRFIDIDVVATIRNEDDAVLLNVVIPQNGRALVGLLYLD